MFVIETEKVIIYPVAYNLYVDKVGKNFHTGMSLRKNGKDNTNSLFSNESKLDEDDEKKIMNDIKYIERMLVLDFQNMMMKDRSNFEILIPDRNTDIVFTNLAVETGFFDKVATDLKIQSKLQDRNNRTIYSNEETRKQLEDINLSAYLKKAYCDYIAEMIMDCLDGKDGKFEFLESSCVFSTKYVNIRKIFRKPEQEKFLLYCLACRVKELAGEVINYKLVCTSKTGAILANIISQMINAPVVYCVEVGPKFAVKPDDIIEKVKEHERYVYIFDFICIGTELKILSTFISDKKSKLICGVGPASYIHCNHPEIAKRKLILNKMHPLINLQDYPKMQYEIKVP